MSDFDRIPDPPMPRFADPDNDPERAEDGEMTAYERQMAEMTYCRTCKREMTRDEFIDHQVHWLSETRDI